MRGADGEDLAFLGYVHVLVHVLQFLVYYDVVAEAVRLRAVLVLLLAG